MKCFRCSKNEAVYKQNETLKLCGMCFGERSQTLFEIWYAWFESDQTEQEPEIWIYNSEKIIKGLI